ncbi:MAG: hypothetical protein Q9191_003938 [Dirinaria sp. TL-2023a]
MAAVHMKRTRSQTKLQRCSPTSEDSKTILKRGSIARYICALCHQGFTRRTTVKEPHFASCVRKHGNPNGVAWDDHPSCYMERPDGTVGPSGTTPAGLSSATNTKKDPDIDLTLEVENDGGLQTGKTEDFDQSPDKGHAVGISANSNTKSSTRSSGPQPCTPEPQRGSSHPEGQPLLRSEIQDPPQTKRLLSGMTMNQLANVAIAASKLKAGSSGTEALKVFQLWRNLLPQGFTSNVLAPSQDFGQKQRQQAVVWMAQDVYKALYGRVQTVDDQLQLVKLWRDILIYLDTWESVRKVEMLLAGAWGEGAGKMLGEMGEDNWKRFMSSS